MSIGPVLGYTANFNFTLISYDFPRWQSYEYDNWNKLDATIAALFGGAGIAGVWKNGTSYVVSQRLIDPSNNVVYVCLVAHTTPVTGTFAQERAANPSYWSNANVTPTNRGAWVINTSYAQYDYVQSGNQFAVCVIPHVSTVFATDAAAGKWSILIDLTGYNPVACLTKANNLSDLANVATARTNLGLGGAALLSPSQVFQTTNNLSEGNPASMRTALGLGTAATQASASFAQTGNNLSDIVNKTAARANLGLGNLATQNTIDPTTQIVTAGAFGKTWITTATNTQATALLSNFVGDPGTTNPGQPGAVGLVPAPANGDAANNKFLSAGGTWAVPPSAAPNIATVSFRNRLINGDMAIDQRNNGASQTIVAGTPVYAIDRFLVSANGANVVGQRVAGTGTAQYRYQFTGAASVTSITFAQRIEVLNSYDLAGQNAIFSVDLANTTLSSVSWTASFANGADNFTGKTQFASGTFTGVTSSIARQTASFSVPAAATTGIEITLSVGAQVSGTWQIGNMQFEIGTAASSFEKVPTSLQLANCQRYFENGAIAMAAYTASGVVAYFPQPFHVRKRIAPTTTTSGAIAANAAASINSSNVDGIFGALLNSGGTAGQSSGSFNWTASAEL